MRRCLCVMLALMLCGNAVPGWAEANEVWSEAVEDAVLPADSAGDSGLTVVIEDAIADLPEVDETPAGDETDARETLPQLPESGLFYALTADSVVVTLENGRTLALDAGDVVLVIDADLSAAEWRVTFEAEALPVIGLVNREALLPMTEAEKAEFMDALSAADGVLLYQDMLEWPLPAPVLQEVEAAEPEAEAGETERVIELEAETLDEAQTVPQTSEETEPEPYAFAPAPSPVTINVSSLTIGVGEVYTQLAVRVVDAEGKDVPDADVIWSSSDANVAKIKAETGALTGVKAGTATITAFVNEIGQATAEVTVMKAPASVKLAQSAMKLGVGMTCAMQATFDDGAHSNALTWGSSKPSVAAIDDRGVVSAVGVGSATITVKTFNGKSATCNVTVGKMPVRVQMSSKMALGVGQTAMLKAVAQDEDGAETGGGLQWSTEQDCVAVDIDTGAIRALSLGTATVKVRAFNGVYATCEIEVVSAPAAIRMNVPSLTLGVKETSTMLRARLVPPSGESACAGEIQWQSSDASIAKVDAKTGAVTGVKAGKAVITATTHNNHSVSAEVTVKSAPTSIKFNAQEVKLSVGMTTRLTGSVNGGVSWSGLTWKSNNKDVASVDAMGYVTAIGAGTATITVQTFNGLSATCKVTVSGTPATLQLVQTELALIVGQQAKIAPTVLDASGKATTAAYTYSIGIRSEDPDCLSVAEDGAITPIKRGSAVIEVRTHNGLSAECRVYVEAAPEEIELSAAELTLGVKESVAAPEVRLIPHEGEQACKAEIAWKSSDTAIAKVNAQTGAITGVKAGTATLTAQTHNGKTATAKVVVMAAPTSLKLQPATVELSKGMRLTLSPVFNKGAYGALTWATSDANVANVDENGTVTAVGTGTATIAAKTYNGITAKCTVNVIEEPFDLILDTKTIDLIEGQTYTLGARVMDEADNPTVATYSYRVYASSTEPACVSVNAATGEVTGLGRGHAVILATTQNGLEATCEVNVRAAPEAIELTPAVLSIGVNETYTGLDVRLIPHAGETEAEAVLTWSSSNEKVVTVNAETGAIKGIKTGTATVTIKAHNGLEQSCQVTVLAAPTSVAFPENALNMRKGTTRALTASPNSGAASGLMRYTSSDENVVETLSGGRVKAVVKGSAVITAETYNGKTATCTVNVVDEPDQVFITEQLKLAVGMRHQLKPSALDVDGDASFADYAFEAVDGTGSVTVDAHGVVTAVRVGTAYVKVKADNGVSDHVSIEDGSRVETVCAVTVSEAPARIELPASVEVDVLDTIRLTPVLYTADNAVTNVGDYALSLDGDAAALSKDGVITGKKIGTAMLTATTYNGLVATCRIDVTGIRYRLFTACSYADPSVKGGLYFTEHNILSMKTAFGKTHVAGVPYEMLGALVNPSKAALLDSLKTSFANSIDTDVNVVYLCSHGFNYIDVDVDSYKQSHNGANPPTHYGLQLPGYTKWNSATKYYITAEEIFSAVQAINGKVILILDSCYSGEFITCMKSQLDAENGRISVLTAASNTKASYYVVKDKTKAFDFFTYYLLLGIGYDEYFNTFDGNFGADTNGDGKVTVREFFNYGHQQVMTYLPEYKTQSWFHGDTTQTPRFYAGKNANIVLYTKVD